MVDIQDGNGQPATLATVLHDHWGAEWQNALTGSKITLLRVTTGKADRVYLIFAETPV